jgi:hypothetical protein
MTEAKENQENKTEEKKTESKKTSVWFSLLVKLFVLINFCFAVVMVVSIVVGASYKEDKSKIPNYKLNLLIDNDELNFDDIYESPLDDVKKDENNHEENTHDSHDDGHKKTDLLTDEKVSPLDMDNDFSLLSRESIYHNALDIIDPLPQMTMYSFGNEIPVSKDGNVPWKIYSKPYRDYGDDLTKIAILIINVGLDKDIDNKIMNAFPENVSVGISPYSANIKETSRKARRRGKETYINIPFERKSGGDSGPYGIMSSISQTENTSRFIKAIGKGIAISGVVNPSGSDSAVPKKETENIIKLANQHGLIYVGKQKPKDDEVIVNYNFLLTKNLNRFNISETYDKFLEFSLKHKHGVIIVDSKPSALVGTLDFIDKVNENENIVLVPISILVK